MAPLSYSVITSLSRSFVYLKLTDMPPTFRQSLEISFKFLRYPPADKPVL